MWPAMSSGEAFCWRMVLTVMSRFRVKPGMTGSGTTIFESFWDQISKPSTSGKATIFRPCRTRSLSPSWDLPPVASQRNLGRMPAQMTAVFSDSTKATVLSGWAESRCSPKRHCVSVQDAGNLPAYLSRECTQSMRCGVAGSLMRWPVWGLYFMILPVRQRPWRSSWKKMTSLSDVTPRR